MRRPRLTGRHWQLILTILSVFAGVPLGLSMRTMHPDHHLITFIGFPGEIFMNMLKMLILPLIAASLIAGLLLLHIETDGHGLLLDHLLCITLV